MFGGRSSKLKELEVDYARLQAERNEFQTRWENEKDERIRVETKLQEIQDAHGKALELEKNKAIAVQQELEAYKTQYDQDAAAWNAKFQEMNDKMAQAQEMEGELSGLKEHLKALEEDKIADYEKELLALREELESANKSLNQSQQEARELANELQQSKTRPTITSAKSPSVKSSLKSPSEKSLKSPKSPKSPKKVKSPKSPQSPKRGKMIRESKMADSVSSPVSNCGPDIKSVEEVAMTPKEDSVIFNDSAFDFDLGEDIDYNLGGNEDDDEMGVGLMMSGSLDLEGGSANVSSPTSPSMPTKKFRPPRSKPRPSKINTDNNTLKAELMVARKNLFEKEQEIQELQQKLDEKTQDLVNQGEKNVALYEKLQQQQQQMQQHADGDGNGLRVMLIREIGGPEADPSQYKNITNRELIRLINQGRTYMDSRNAPHSVQSITNEAQGLSRAKQALSSSESEILDKNKISSEFTNSELTLDESFRNLFGGTGDEEMPEVEEGTNDSSSDQQLVSRADALRLEADIRILKQTNKRLQHKVEEMQAIHENGQAALETVVNLKRRSEDLGRRLRTEKDMRSKTEAELENTKERVKQLSKHIEKLMLHLKHEAASKNSAATELKNYKKEVTLLRQRNTILSKKNKARERMLNELREGSRILEDQLRLMDQKYVTLRTKLDWTRATSNKEVQRIQKEANKLRASFALAYSQMGSIDQSFQGNMNFAGLLKGPQSDDEDDESSSEDDDEDDDDDEEEDEKVQEQEEEGSKTNHSIKKEEPKVRSKDIPMKKPTASFDTSIISSSQSSDMLPSIESILPSKGDRYEPRG